MAKLFSVKAELEAIELNLTHYKESLITLGAPPNSSDIRCVKSFVSAVRETLAGLNPKNKLLEKSLPRLEKALAELEAIVVRFEPKIQPFRKRQPQPQPVVTDDSKVLGVEDLKKAVAASRELFDD